MGFVQAVQASAELGQWQVLSQVPVVRKATAAIHADPAMAAELSRPIDEDLGLVTGPRSSSDAGSR